MTKQNSECTYREMYAQPESFAAITATLPAIFETLDQVFAQSWDELIFTGCGTSLYLAQSAAFAFSSQCGVPAKGVPCSELNFYPEAFVGHGRKTLVLPITRKSYTTEVRMAIDRVRQVEGVKTLAITCDPDSAAYNDYMILSPETAEDSVIMTRSFTSMIYLSTVLALYAAGKRADVERMADGYDQMARDLLPETEAMARRILAENPGLNLFITLGQGVNYGIANECMNKMKEMGIANSEAYYSLEYRHGPMSLVDEHTLIVLLGDDASIDYDAKLMKQMKGFGAVTLAIGRNARSRYPDCRYHLNLPQERSSLEYAAVIGFIGQFLGYEIARHKGIDADSPRHLTQAIVLEK